MHVCCEGCPPAVRSRSPSRTLLAGLCPFVPAAGFEEQPWFGQLFEYGLPQQGGEGGQQQQDGEDDEDSALVPRLVAKLVLPLVLQRARHCWAATSARQSRALAAALEALLVFDLAREDDMHELLRLAQQRLADAVQAAAVPAFPPAATQAHARTRAVLARRFGKAVRVLRSVAAFDGVLERPWLLRLALGDLLQVTV